MNSKIKKEIQDAHRITKLSIREIAMKWGFTEIQVEKVIWPSGKNPKVLPPVVSRIRPKPKPKSKEKELTIEEFKQKLGLDNKGSVVQGTTIRETKALEETLTQQQKYINAAKKSWETRRKKAIEREKTNAKPAGHLVESERKTGNSQPDKASPPDRNEEVLKLLSEAVDYFSVGMDIVKKAINLLRKDDEATET